MLLVSFQVYEYYITVDVEGVGVELLSIPLKADCQVGLDFLVRRRLQQTIRCEIGSSSRPLNTDCNGRPAWPAEACGETFV